MYREIGRRLTRQLVALPHIRPEHGVAIAEYVGAYVRSRVIDRFLQRVGLLKTTRDGLDAHPVMVKSRGHLSLLLARLGDQLGLNPAAAAAMKLGDPIDVGGDPALALQAALEKREREAEEQETQETQEGPS